MFWCDFEKNTSKKPMQDLGTYATEACKYANLLLWCYGKQELGLFLKIRRLLRCWKARAEQSIFAVKKQYYKTNQTPSFENNLFTRLAYRHNCRFKDLFIKNYHNASWDKQYMWPDLVVASHRHIVHEAGYLSFFKSNLNDKRWMLKKVLTSKKILHTKKLSFDNLSEDIFS